MLLSTNISTITTAISSVGFPIVMCLIMVYLNNQQENKHDKEMKEISKAIENNTLAMVQLANKLNNEV